MTGVQTCALTICVGELLGKSVDMLGQYWEVLGTWWETVGKLLGNGWEMPRTCWENVEELLEKCCKKVEEMLNGLKNCLRRS